jgi:hypothetical protein
MADSETRTYTVWNRDNTSTRVTSLVINNDSNVAHHLAFTGAWESPYAGQTDFTGNTTVVSQSVTYLSDVDDVVKQYVSNSGTSLVVNSTASLVIGYTLNGNGYTAGQTLVGISTSTVVTSAGPNGSPIVGDNIVFVPPQYSMRVSSNSGVSPGWIATGNGYNGQTAVSFSSTNYIIMSDGPSGGTTPGSTVTFVSDQPVLTLAAHSSSTFTARYTNNTGNLGSWPSTFTFTAQSTMTITKLVSNFVGIGTAPVDPGGNGGGGFDGGGNGPGDNGDGPAPGPADNGVSVAGEANQGQDGNGSIGDGSGVNGDSATA